MAALAVPSDTFFTIGAGTRVGAIVFKMVKGGLFLATIDEM